MPRLIRLTHEVFSKHIQPRHLCLPVLVGPGQEHGVIWGADGGLVCPRIKQGEPAQWLRWQAVPGLQLDTSRPEVAEALSHRDANLPVQGPPSGPGDYWLWMTWPAGISVWFGAVSPDGSGGLYVWLDDVHAPVSLDRIGERIIKHQKIARPTP